MTWQVQAVKELWWERYDLQAKLFQANKRAKWLQEDRVRMANEAALVNGEVWRLRKEKAVLEVNLQKEKDEVGGWYDAAVALWRRLI